jgi:release factor glutamine methyltransferase
MLNATTTIAETIRRAKQLGVAGADIEILLARRLGKDRSFVLAFPERAVDALSETLNSDLERLAQREPLALVLGEREFYGLRLMVNEHVLVPRPETELLVEVALTLLSNEARVLDLGTGSGAIALALKHTLPSLELHAVDHSSEALAVAKLNAAKLGLIVQWHLGSWFEPVPQGLGFDLVISNPPYLAADDPHLAELSFEPRDALVAARNGLAAFEAIASVASTWLKPSGCLMFEHGHMQAEAVRSILLAQGFDRVQSHDDLAGIARLSMGIWNERARSCGVSQIP